MVECRIPGHITGLYIFAVVNLCALLNISLVSADVFVISTKDNHTKTVATMEDIQAAFGPDFPDDGLIGRVVYVTPHNACTKVDPAPFGTDLPWIALISRGPCHFDLKVLNAQKANFSAAIIHNYEGQDSVTKMSGDSSQIEIPSVFIGYTHGKELAKKYDYTNRTVVIKIQEYGNDGFTSYFWPFTVVVSICFLMLIVFSIFKCIRYFQYKRRTRLSTKALKKIPTRKYKKGDHYDTCAICLEDYEEGEKLRVLPCDHTYHCKCIDPWLTKRKKTCPQCKRRVIPGQETDSDSETEGEASGASENTPLLGNNNSRSFLPSHGRVPTYDGRNPRRSARRGHSAAVVVDEETPREAAAPAQEAEDESDDSDEELEGAVGGLGISDQQGSGDDATDVVVEVEQIYRDYPAKSQPADDENAAVDNTTVTAPLTSSDRHSPARVEGSINVAFTSSGSGDDDGSGGTGGRGKKKRKSNHVV